MPKRRETGRKPLKLPGPDARFRYSTLTTTDRVSTADAPHARLGAGAAYDSLAIALAFGLALAALATWLTFGAFPRLPAAQTN